MPKWLRDLEGGPLILKATLMYRGKAEIKINQSLWRDNAYIETPAGWKGAVGGSHESEGSAGRK